MVAGHPLTPRARRADRRQAGDVVPPRGFEPLISTLKGWRPRPLDDGGRRGPSLAEGPAQAAVVASWKRMIAQAAAPAAAMAAKPPTSATSSIRPPLPRSRPARHTERRQYTASAANTIASTTEAAANSGIWVASRTVRKYAVKAIDPTTAMTRKTAPGETRRPRG